MQFERLFGFLAPLLNYRPPILHSTPQNLQNAHILSTPQFAECQLLAYRFHALGQTLYGVRIVFFARGARKTKYSVLAGQTYHTQLLIRMEDAVIMGDREFGTIALGLDGSGAQRGMFLERLLMRFDMFGRGTVILLLTLNVFSFFFLLHERDQNLVCELVDHLDLIFPQIDCLVASPTPGLRYSVHVQLVFMVGKGCTSNTVAMATGELDQNVVLSALLALTLGRSCFRFHCRCYNCINMILSRRIIYWGTKERIVFFGSGKVALPSLQALRPIYPQLQVVTQSSQGQTKIGNPVEIYCRENNLNWSSPIRSRHDKQARKEEWTQYLSKLDQVDIGVVCSYGYMLPPRTISKFSQGMIVVHPSLLPKFRGGAPIFHAIANGQVSSGVSYVQISEHHFDQGNILHQVECPLDPMGSYQAIQASLSDLASQNLPFVLDNLSNLRPGTPQLNLIQNTPKELIRAPLVTSTKLDINNSAETVFNWSRALQSPKVYFLAKENWLILKFEREFRQGDGELGSFLLEGKRLYLRCADRFLRVKSWYQPKQKQQHPGRFIAQFIKSNQYPQQSIRVK